MRRILSFIDHAESIIRDTLGNESGTYITLFSMRWDSVFNEPAS